MEGMNFDTAAAAQTVRHLKELEQEMESRVLPGLEECREELPGAWAGASVDQFLQITDRELEKGRRTWKLLKETRISLEEAIQKVRLMEEKTKEIAEIRKY